MAQSRLTRRDEARKSYDKAIAWLKKNEQTLAKDKTRAEELRRFRDETEAVLGLKNNR